MDLSSIHKRSTRSLVFTVIFCWFFGGYYVADGVQRLLHDRLAYRWPSSFLFCSAYVAIGIFLRSCSCAEFPPMRPLNSLPPRSSLLTAPTRGDRGSRALLGLSGSETRTHTRPCRLTAECAVLYAGSR
jgi:hypothetical protein